MAQENKVQMPGVFGGLTRYDSSSNSKFTFSPNTVIFFIIAIILFVIALKLFLPITYVPTTTTGAPVGQGGFIIPLLI